MTLTGKRHVHGCWEGLQGADDHTQLAASALSGGCRRSSLSTMKGRGHQVTLQCVTKSHVRTTPSPASASVREMQIRHGRAEGTLREAPRKEDSKWTQMCIREGVEKSTPGEGVRRSPNRLAAPLSGSTSEDRVPILSTAVAYIAQ